MQPGSKITAVLQAIWDDAGEPLLVSLIPTLLALMPPPFGPFAASAFVWVMKLPVIGPWLNSKLKQFVDVAIAQGVIDVKVTWLDHLSTDAKAKWAGEITVLKQYGAEKKIMSPEELAAYDSALQQVGQNHPGVVHA